MRLGKLIGLPWFFIGIIAASINAVLGLGSYQLGVALSSSYPTLWTIPIIANTITFIMGLSAIISIILAILGLIAFFIAIFHK